MLIHLQINNFTIIEEIEIDFKSGMTVFTGETGVGKSILLDALMLCLGGRSDSRLIRHGKEQADVVACFDISTLEEAKNWLNKNGFDITKECFLRRVLTSDGRSRAYINQQMVPVQSLQQLGELLIEIHGQHEQQHLLKREHQRKLFDEFINNDALLNEIKSIYQQWRDAKTKLESLKAAGDQSARKSLLQYQIEELTLLNLQENEFEELQQQSKRISERESVLKATQQALWLSTENSESNILASLHQIQFLLEPFKQHEKTIENSYNLFSESLILLKEASNELSNFLSDTDLDNESTQSIQERLEKIYDLARKHKVRASELFQHQQTLEQELFEINNNEVPIQQLEKTILELEKKYRDVAMQLSTKRQEHIKSFNEKISERVRVLGMPNSEFEATIIPYDEIEPRLSGNEQIEFLVKMNKGQTFAPLSKVASGGELSRISLAIHVISAQLNSTATLIFDEIDTGIGGTTAAIVGKSLRELANHVQVLCVTHLAQVAAFGHQHLQVQKHSDNDNTYSKIELLNKKSRIQEIARMIGGMTVNQQTLAHAKTMLAECES